MKVFYLLIGSLFLGVMAFALPFEISIDSTGVVISATKPSEKRKLPEQLSKKRKVTNQLNSSVFKQDQQAYLAQLLLAPSISVSKSVTVQGGGNAVPGGILNYSISVSNTASGSANDASGVVVTDQLVNDLTLVSGSLKATPIAANDAYNCVGNVGITLPAATGVTSNDINPIATNALTITAFDATSANGGTVTMTTSGVNLGAFTYTPAAGFSGTDTFTYTIDNGSGITNSSRTATVTITVSTPIWFVNIAATSNGTGTIASPFKDWSNFATANALTGATNPAANQTIFIYDGTYSGTATLKSGQKVLGQGANISLESFAGVTVPSYTSLPLPNTNGTKPNLTSGGITITLGSNNTLRGFDMGNSTKDIVGSSFGTLTASEMDLNGTGAALDLAIGTLACSFSDISANTSTATAVKATGVGGSITNTTGTITATNNLAINITGTNSSNKVSLGLTFVSVSASGAANGLNIQNTTGSLSVTGNGSTAGSGGTIQNTTENGVYLNNANSISLNYVNITNTSKSCIYANNLSGTCAINNCTVSLGAGALSVPTTPIATSYDRRCVHILNENVAMTLNVNNSTFTGQLTTSPNDNHGIAYETTTAATNSTVGTLNIKNSTFNRFNNYAVYTTSTGSAITDVGIQGSSVNYDGGTTYVGGAFHLYNLRSAKTTFNVINNSSILTKGGLPIEFYTNNFDGSDFTPASGRGMEGKFNNNILTRHSTDAGTAVNILVRGKSNGVVQVSGNTITKGNLTVQAVENTPNATTENARLDATITNNVIEEILSNYGIDVISGGSSNTAFSSIVNCVKISGNNVTPRDAGGFGIMRFRTNGNADGDGFNVIWLERVNGTETGLADYWNKNNINSPLPAGTDNATIAPNRIFNSGFGGIGNKIFKVAGTCLTPANAAPARIAAPEYVSGLATQDSLDLAITTPIQEETPTDGPVSTVEQKESLEARTSVNTPIENAAARMMAGETVTVNGSGAGFNLPAGKSTTITFSATVATVPSTCAITNVASVSGSNFTTVNSNTTTTNLIVAPPTGVTGATSICNGKSISLSATCPNGSVNWYTTAAPTTLLGNSASGANFSQSPTVNTTYQAACLVGGCESAKTNTGLITVNALPVPTPGSNSPVCAGSTLNLTSAASTSYLWAGPNSFTSTLRNPSISNVTIVAGNTYTITQTNSSNCTATATISVTVNPLNNISLTSAGGTNAQSVAVNTPISNITYTTTGATGATFDGLPTGVTGIWSNNVVTISGTPNTAVGSPFNYTVTLTGGCGTVTANGTITVNTITANNNSPICAGNTLNLSSSGGVGYLWAGPNTFTSTSQNPSFSNATSDLSGTYTVTVTVSGGATATATTAVTVNAVPTATASSNSPVCAGETVSLTGGGVGTYLWAGPGGYSSTTQSPNISSATTSSTGTYTITVTGIGNCTSTATTAVTVNSFPTASVTPSTQTICSGGPINTIAITGTGTSYTWTRNNTTGVTGIAASGSGNISGSLTNTTEAPITVTFTITPVGACSGTPITATVVVNPIPTVVASTPSQTICSGQSISGITFNNPPPSAQPIPDPSSDLAPTAPKPEKGIGFSSFVAGTVFTWTRDNTVTVGGIAASGSGNISGTLINTTASPITVTFTITPSYTNAGATCTGTPITVTVIVNPNPTAVLSDAGTAFCQGGSTTLSGNADPNYTYAWERSLSGIANPNSFTAFGGTAQTQVVSSSGVYRVVVTNQYNCSARDTTAIHFADFTFNGSLATGDAQQTGRMNRFGVVSTCAAAKSYPGSFTTSGARLYDSYTITNPRNVPVCATIGIKSGCGVNMFSAAYLGSFNPADVSANYLADPGSSFPLTGFYEATIPANGTIVVVVHEVNTGTGCGNYTLTVELPREAVGISVTPNNPICVPGTPVSLTASTANSYAWTGGGTFSTQTINPSPTATTTYNVALGYGNGTCNATATAQVVINPAPTVSSNSPMCAGGTLNLSSGTANSYSWTSPSGFTSSAQNPSIPNVSTSQGGTYTLVAVNGGCTSTTTIAVIVNPLPSITTGLSPAICAGATSFTIPHTASANSPTTYSISGTGITTVTDGTLTPSLITVNLTNPAVGSSSYAYTMTVKNANNCTSGNVTGSVTVNPPVTLNCPTNTTTTACQTQAAVNTAFTEWLATATASGGANGVLTNNNTGAPSACGGSTTVTFTYTNDCSPATSTCQATFTVPAPPTVILTCPINTTTTANQTQTAVNTAFANWLATATASGGCNGILTNNNTGAPSACGGSTTVTFTYTSTCSPSTTTCQSVFTVPASTISTTAGNNSPICTGSTLNLTAGAGFTSYAWTGVNGFSSTDQNPSILNATTSLTGTYQVLVTNSNGCTAMATTSATVNPTPATPTTQADTQIIFGGSITLTATGCSNVNDVLKWYQTADNALVTMPVSPTATTNYYAKCETTLNGITCISPNSNNVTVTVLQPQPPVATGATICTGSSVTLTATGCTGSTGTFVLKWYLNATDALVTMPVSPTTNTDYYAKCEQTFNSVTAVSAKSNVVTVTVLSPIAPVATGGTIYNGNSISLNATGCTGSGFVIKWYQTADDALVTMPVSPTVTTQYYAKCEQTTNSVTCLSPKSNDVTLTVVNRIFVDITKVSAPIQNGNSWATAYGNLQTGLAAATPGVEVWVAKGTYKTTTTNTRTIYFNIPNNVIVYGGFAGTENALSERDFRTNESILSGEIGNLGSITDNSYHVVVFDGSTNNTVLDGFTITGGNASFDPNRSVSLPVTNTITASTLETGGGIMAKNAAAPIIANCTFTKNSAIVGGGLFAADASLVTITHCKFNSNQATFGSGIYLQDGSNGKVSNTLLNGNRGIGSFYNNNSSPQISNCTIAGNGGYSGGIFNSNSSPVVINSIIWGNAKPINDTQSIITYSIVEGGYAGIGNLNYDPQFIDPNPEGISPTTNGNFQLKEKSLAIDRGLNGTITLSDKDLAGNPRRYNGGRVDMGAYEYQGVGTANLLISITSGNWESGLTWDAGRSPQIGDIVIIDQNHIVTINGNANAQSVEYRGTGSLRFNSATSKLNIGF